MVLVLTSIQAHLKATLLCLMEVIIFELNMKTLAEGGQSKPI